MGRATRWLKALFGIQSKEKDTTNEHSVTSKDKNRWSSGHRGWDGAVLCNNSATIPPNITPAEAEWLRAFYSEPDSEQKQQARAMAAATAAAADAAVAAAQAAAAAVRFTSQGGGTVMFGGRRERGAAVKIQSLFRGYLARKALRALKGLVKIQALVRGFLVRKQAAATLYSIEALIRVQASVRAMKTRRFINYDESYPQFEARKSLDKFDEHALHTRMPCASFEAGTTALDESPKIVEVDTGCRPRSRLRTSNACTRSSDSYDNSISSPLSCRIPARLSMPEPDSHGLSEQELAHFSTPQSTPRFGSSCKCTTATATPAKSESYFSSYAQHPNYMNKTQSFKAKLRSQSAPKQRPDPGPARRNSMRSGLQDREAISFKNAIVGKLGSSSNFVRGNLEF